MQEIKIYVAANGALGVIRDYANAKGQSAPTLVRGCEVLLRLRLFANADGDTPYPIEQLQNIAAWQFVMDDDFDSKTAYKLVADNDNITVDTVTDTIDDVERTFTEVSIPLTSTNTKQLADWLGTAKSKSGLHGELIGYDASGDDVFVLQIENFTFRNRLSSAGEPTELDAEYLTAAQVQAIAAGLQKQINELEVGEGGSTEASAIMVSESAQFYAGESVEAALQTIGGQLNGINAELAVI